MVGLAPPNSGAAAPFHGTLIEAVAEGWWYSALLPDARTVLVYMTDADLLTKAPKDRARHWLEKLHQTVHTYGRVANERLCSQPAVVPANSSRLERFCGANWLAAGDAALAFDPLSGQGIYRGLQFAILAAQAIDAHFAGNSTSLTSYAHKAGQTFDQYLQLRKLYYGRERRWPLSIFWQRRNALACEVLDTSQEQQELRALTETGFAL
jgi:flavin-dependent dehydrogenase